MVVIECAAGNKMRRNGEGVHLMGEIVGLRVDGADSVFPPEKSALPGVAPLSTEKEPHHQQAIQTDNKKAPREALFNYQVNLLTSKS